MNGALSAKLNHAGIDIAGSKVSPASLRSLVERIADGTISGKIARDVFDAMWAGDGTADEIIEKRGLKQISDTGALDKLVDEVLAANAAQIADYRAGKAKAFNALVGQVMKASKGKANPQQVNDILRRKLDAMA
jgi:aspartyl-tRNA(Asn)/glutamyl-tRNA(Gln) amidotransferase subunit B